MIGNASVLLFRHPARKAGRTALRGFFSDLADRIGKGRGAACLITTDAELRRLNRRFRGEDHATDVLSFPAPAAGDQLGEIAISYDRAAAQAEQFGHSVEEELRILMVHGLLHLTGLDHEGDRGTMARAERRWRRRLGLPQGLIERTRA